MHDLNNTNTVVVLRLACKFFCQSYALFKACYSTDIMLHMFIIYMYINDVTVINDYNVCGSVTWLHLMACIKPTECVCLDASCGS